MIHLFTNTKDFTSFRASIATDKKVALVPTMGNLHAGHLSLAELAYQDHDVVIVTIFVNPKQFGANEDLDKYPKTLDDDIAKLSSQVRQLSNKTLVVFAPSSAGEIYPTGFNEVIEVKHPMTQELCAKFRPTHFSGVTTVVYQLFKLANADTAFFGQKDYQHLQIIKQMVKDYDLSVTIKSGAIVRDNDGLALSSRNQYLSKNERKEALKLSQGLNSVKEKLQDNYELALEAASSIKENDSNWQYLEILSSNDLSAPNKQTKSFVIAGAYVLGNTRLIDNIVVDS